MGTTPRLTVGLAVYNGANHLARFLDALHAQSDEDFEPIAWDDTSLDGTPSISGRYKRLSSRIGSFRAGRGAGLTTSGSSVGYLATAANGVGTAG